MTRPPDVRLARMEDADRLAEILVRSWTATYRGIMPDPVLDRLSIADRAERWRASIRDAAPDDARRRWVVTEDGVVHGYAITGPGQGDFLPPPEGAGELDSLYLHPAAMGRGLGRTLLAHALDDLRARGFDPLILWAFEANRHARRFYETAGFVHDADSTWTLEGIPIPVVRYRLAAPASSADPPA